MYIAKGYVQSLSLYIAKGGVSYGCFHEDRQRLDIIACQILQHAHVQYTCPAMRCVNRDAYICSGCAVSRHEAGTVRTLMETPGTAICSLNKKTLGNPSIPLTLVKTVVLMQKHFWGGSFLAPWVGFSNFKRSCYYYCYYYCLLLLTTTDYCHFNSLNSLSVRVPHNVSSE